jgi:hypothetical protein
LPEKHLTHVLQKSVRIADNIPWHETTNSLIELAQVVQGLCQKSYFGLLYPPRVDIYRLTLSGLAMCRHPSTCFTVKVWDEC